MRIPTSHYGPAVGAADLTAEVRPDAALAQRRGGERTKTAAASPSQRDFGRQKRLAHASQALRTALRGSPLHSTCVPTQLIRVPRG